MSSSSTSTPARSAFSVPSTQASPMVKPLHDPQRSAVVVQQVAPLGAVRANQVVPGQTVDPSIPGAGLGQKALLAKKFATAQGSTISPTDALQSPCTAKLAGAKQRRFAKFGAGATGGGGKKIAGPRFMEVQQDENADPRRS